MENIENIEVCYVLIAILVIANFLLICFFLIKDNTPEDQEDLYDEDGNHIYYDRKLIRYNKKRNS